MIIKYIWLEMGFFIIISTIIFIIGKIKKSKNIKKVSISLLTVFILLGFIRTIPIFIDVNQKSYITEYVTYERIQDSRKSWFGSLAYISNKDGKNKTLVEVTNNYPFGNYTGIVTYAQHSRVILNFKDYQKVKK